MPTFLLLLVLFVAAPLVELAILIKVGAQIGVLPTIGLCLLTAALGSALVRSQGSEVLRTLRRQLDLGRLPVEEAFSGICILVAGILLLTPGFVTDALGFLLLVPAFRRALYRRLRAHFDVVAVGGRGSPFPGEPPVIDVSYEELHDDELPPGRGWGRR